MAIVVGVEGQSKVGRKDKKGSDRTSDTYRRATLLDGYKCRS